MRLHVVLPKHQPVQDTRLILRSMVRAGAAAAVRCSMVVATADPRVLTLLTVYTVCECA